MLKSLTTALICLPFVAFGGESWTVETTPGSGSWVDNPACTGQCAHDRENARQPDRPKPGKPVQIDGEKPKDRPTLKADKRGREPPISTYIGHWCVNPAALPACVDCADPKSGKPRPPRPMTLKPCGPLVHIKGGVVGQW